MKTIKKKTILIVVAALALTLVISGLAFATVPQSQSQGGNNLRSDAGTTTQLCVREDCNNFIDEDDDGICDNCIAATGQGQGTGQGQRQSQSQNQGQGQGTGFVDADGDGVCDNRGTGTGQGTGFVDADGDGVCDNRGTGAGHGHGKGYRHR